MGPKRKSKENQNNCKAFNRTRGAIENIGKLLGFHLGRHQR